jgi:ornithine carbamoyltransferase
MKTQLKGRSVLTLMDFTGEEIRDILDLAVECKHSAPQQRFKGKTLAMIFEKRSTRTRCAFETAFGEEGGHPVFLSTDDIQLGGKETVEDTAHVLGRMYSAIEFRGYKQSTVEALARYSGIPVYNGLTDLFHPTQALADVMTLEENFGNCRGKKLVFVGDGRNNVATSLCVISAKLGMQLSIVCPDELRPDAAVLERLGYAGISIGSSLEALAGADAVYTDVWVSMGEEALREERLALLGSYQVNAELMARTGRKDSIFLHCLPAIRGEEVTADIIDGEMSRVWDQAENRKHTIKAMMLATLCDL